MRTTSRSIAPSTDSASPTKRVFCKPACGRRAPNVLVFPELQSANAAYKLVWRLGKAEAIGPILMGMGKPVHVLQRGVEVSDIVNMAAFGVVDAQSRKK